MMSMKTTYLSCAVEDIAKAGELLKHGELVAVPTETVYGLAANAFDAAAVSKIFEAKGRPQDNPLIVHIDNLDTLYFLSDNVPDEAATLADAFWPGPLTMIVPRGEAVPAVVSAGLDTVAVRFPSDETAKAIIAAAGVPLAAPSANLSGSPSPTTADRVKADLDGRIAAVVCGGECEVGLESTVISLCTNPPRLLRPGGITLEQLRAVLGEVAADDAIVNPVKEGQQVASPGMKYKHYSPRCEVTIVDGDAKAFAAYVNAHKADGTAALCFEGEDALLDVPALSFGRRDDDAAQARCLFEVLRTADDRGYQTLYAACPRKDGLGLAVYNRLLRAAGFRVVTV